MEATYLGNVKGNYQSFLTAHAACFGFIFSQGFGRFIQCRQNTIPARYNVK
jgi:hypothetical protein